MRGACARLVRLDIGVDACPVTQVYQTKNALIAPYTRVKKSTSALISQPHPPSEVFVLIHLCAKANITYFVQTINFRSMHHARSFFIAYFNSLPPLKSKQKTTTARCEHLLSRLEKRTKARCLDVSIKHFLTKTNLTCKKGGQHEVVRPFVRS